MENRSLGQGVEGLVSSEAGLPGLQMATFSLRLPSIDVYMYVLLD